MHCPCQESRVGSGSFLCFKGQVTFGPSLLYSDSGRKGHKNTELSPRDKYTQYSYEADEPKEILESTKVILYSYCLLAKNSGEYLG